MKLDHKKKKVKNKKSLYIFIPDMYTTITWLCFYTVYLFTSIIVSFFGLKISSYPIIYIISLSNTMAEKSGSSGQKNIPTNELFARNPHWNIQLGPSVFSPGHRPGFCRKGSTPPSRPVDAETDALIGRRIHGWW